jgi:cell division protein FtsB
VKEISDLRSKNEQLQCNIQAVSEGKEALIADSHNLNNQVKSLDTRNGALQEENTKLSERNESLLKEIVGLRNKVRELEHDWKQATDDLEGAAAAEAKFADLHAQMGAALRVMSSKRSNIRVSSSPPDNLERHPSPLDPTNSHTLAKLKTSPPPAPSQAVTRSSLPQRPLLSNSGDMSDPSYQRVSIKGSPIAHSRHRSPPPSRRENLEPGEIERRRSWFARR